MRFNLSKWSALLLIACAAIFGLSIFIGLQTAGILVPVPTISLVVKSSHPPLEITPPATTLSQKPIVLRAFGDIMLGRNVEAWVKKTGNPRYPFERIHPLLTGADRLMANLEGPIPSRHIPTPTGSVRFSFATSSAQALVDEGFNILSLANNHALDYGKKEFSNTQQWLSEHGIQPIGHPQLAAEEYTIAPVIDERQFVFMSFNAHPDGYTEDKLDLVKKLKQKHPDSFVVVTIHWGDEYQLRSNKKQQAFARKLIDAGADVIFGHHPHVVQELEVYKDRVVFYSLGNFIFDQYFSRDTQEGLAVEMQISKEGLTYILYPLQSDASQVTVMGSERAQDFLSQLAERSGAEYQDEIRMGTIVFTGKNP